ncbi:MAG TPA: hypothetical protein VGP20_10385, partial [Steroidobacteraceae bacterium]|nr:hypothetical protein [Steroidobacteraceae bacterium]
MHQGSSGRARVALGEYQVDYREHAIETFIENPQFRRLVRDARDADFALRPHQPLSHRFGADQERTRHGLGRQTAYRTQRQG